MMSAKLSLYNMKTLVSCILLWSTIILIVQGQDKQSILLPTCPMPLSDDIVPIINERVQQAFNIGQAIQSINESTGKVNVVPHQITNCTNGPRKELHYEPNVFYYPPIWKLSCSQLKCKQPGCIATKIKKKTVFVLAYRYNGRKWVWTCERVTYENHLNCKCKECKDIKSYRDCVRTTTCPNCPFYKRRSNCYWKPLPLQQQTEEANSTRLISLPRGNCDCCTHSGLCRNPKHIFNAQKCQCVCRRISVCRKGYVFDPICCVCRPINCPGNQQWNQKTCKCQCRGLAICLPPKSKWDEVQCKCVCPNIHKCPPNYIWNKDCCRCQPLKCPGKQVWNQKACECLCRGPEICQPPKSKWDKVECKCVCPNIQKCPPNYKWNKDCCKCQPLECPGNQVWDKLLCKCQCPIIYRCPPGQVWDSNLCKCACKKRCPLGSYLDVKTCRCLADCTRVSARDCATVFCRTQPKNLCEYNSKKGCQCPGCCQDHPDKMINYDCSTLNQHGERRCNAVWGGTTCQWNCN